jgi:hypothetical protein
VTRPQLAETLLALVAGVEAPQGAATVIEVDLLVPMEISVAIDDVRGIVVHAAPGHSRFVSGFLPPVHRTRLRIVAQDGS